MMVELQKTQIYYENNIIHYHQKIRDSVLNYSSSKTPNTAMFQFPYILK